VTTGEEQTPRFAQGPRRPSRDAAGRHVDRWPEIRAALADLLAECEEITSRGRAEFDAPRSLTYRAAEAVVIHFGDLVERRLPEDRRASVPADLPLHAVRTTRNILSHNYRDADRGIVWRVIEGDIPRALRAILASDE
jgi:uncharacterized protein with HEPN domain